MPASKRTVSFFDIWKSLAPATTPLVIAAERMGWKVFQFSPELLASNPAACVSKVLGSI